MHLTARKSTLLLVFTAIAVVFLYLTSSITGFAKVIPDGGETKSSTSVAMPSNDSRNSNIHGSAKDQVKNDSQTPRRKISLIVRMRGEMANLLSHLVFAKGIQLWTEQNYPHLTLELIGERQSGTKWKRAVEHLQCFPNLRGINFEGGRSDKTGDFITRKEQQRAWVGNENHRGKLLIDRGDSNCGDDELFCLNEQLEFFRNLLLQQEGKGNTTYLNKNNVSEEAVQEEDEDSQENRYSLPFLITNRLATFDVVVDQYFPEIQEFLAFDFDACCGFAPIPSPDEVVVHLRNFRGEMRKRNYLGLGYEELSPKRMARELLSHLPANSKVAIASRGEAYIDQYLHAFHEQGLIVRTTPTNYSSIQDFCFLLQAQRELIGTMRSTFTRWAALLGKAQHVHLYSIDSPHTRSAQRVETSEERMHYQWKRNELKNKINYHIFASNGTLDW